MLFSLCCASLILVSGSDAAPAGYAHPELLIEAADLAKPEVARRFHILDARDKDDYQEGHIPGAVWVNEAQWAKAFAANQDPTAWEKRVGDLGVDRDTPTVVYGAGSTPDAARIWWILHYWGLKDVRLLDGGWHAWTAGHHITSARRKPVAPVDAHLIAHPERLATRDQILNALKKNSFEVIDTRSDDEYCGRAKTAKRAGAIPGAVHLEWHDVIDPKTKRFRSAAELAKIFHQAHIDLDRMTVTHCQSGGRAAVMAFALELMGGQHVRNYYRSWAEWGNDPTTPIVTPPSAH